MKKIDPSRFQGYLVGQVLASGIGFVLLAFEDFGGFYYRNHYAGVESYGYIFFGSGILSTLLILLGMGGLLISFQAALKTLQAKKDVSREFIRGNAIISIKGGLLAWGLAAVGGAVFAIDSTLDGIEWWLDSGFYGAFLGGGLTAFFGKLIKDGVDS